MLEKYACIHIARQTDRQTHIPSLSVTNCTAVSMNIVKTAWEREDAEFMAVEAVCREA